MENAEEILVVILAAALAVFLTLAIVATIKIIQILNSLKRVTEKAEEITTKAAAISETIQKAAGPIAIGRLFTKLSKAILDHTSKNSKSKAKDG